MLLASGELVFAEEWRVTMEKLFEYYIESGDFHFKYARGEPSAKGEEFHNYNEIVFFIKGKSHFTSKNIQQDLIEGSMVLIPKEHFHQFRISDSENYVRCILGFYGADTISVLTDEVMNAVKLIAEPDRRLVSSFEDIIGILKKHIPEHEKLMFIRASLIQLLIYLKHIDSEIVIKNICLSPIVSGALEIIDRHYAEKLSVKNIAERLYISPSTLSHKFSRELNISVYRYIIQKRFSAVRERVKNGESLTSAVLNSGFNDYSDFYRLRKKSECS